MSRWFVLGIALVVACSKEGDDVPAQMTAAGKPDSTVAAGSGSSGGTSGGRAGEYTGIMTFDEYNWIAVQKYQGVVQYELSHGNEAAPGRWSPTMDGPVRRDRVLAALR